MVAHIVCGLVVALSVWLALLIAGVVEEMGAVALAALVNRPADLERVVVGLIRSGCSEGYVRGWAAAWIGGEETRAEEDGDQEFACGYAAGASAVERNAARGGRF